VDLLIQEIATSN